MRQPTASPIVPFYLGERPDAEGRLLQMIWVWDDETLECAHDYIQWLFPLADSSAYNPSAPLVTDGVLQAFQQNPQLRQNLLKSLDVMLHFYGLRRQMAGDENVVVRAAHYADRSREWVQPLDHNHLRITRILKCLTTLGLAAEAQTFYQCLEQIY
ncbi:MAG: opioid growth factor receptor-related protein [Cyanobacteria bacterium J06628_6]